MAFPIERVPSAVGNTIAVAFSGGSNDIPSYSLADLSACLDKGDRDFFRRQFSGKVVIVGSDIASADQILTTKRFANPLLPQNGERCASPAPAKVSATPFHERGLFPGDGGRQSDPRRSPARTAPGRLCDVVHGGSSDRDWRLGLGAPVMLAGGAVAALIWIALTTLAFQHFVALPFFEPIVCAVRPSAPRSGCVSGSRSGKAVPEHAFGLYLAPDVIDRHDVFGRVADSWRRDA